jgi:von Willebrand factor type A domain
MRVRCILFIILLFTAKSGYPEKDRNDEIDNELQIVFCLDLSGSTNGLINDMRDNLWHIINQANLLSPKPELKIGVVGFSRPSFKKENSYVKVLCDLTDDFDYLSAELSKIRPTIEKGDQLVGAALRKSVTDISWSENDKAKKIIYIVGNGAVADVTYEYVNSCALAVKRNIIINSIYIIGKNKAKELPGWHRIATMGMGLNAECTVGFREDVSKEELMNTELFEAARNYNLTSFYFNINGYTKYMNYRKSDSAAYAGGNASFYERLYYKNKYFTNSYNASWDMVDYFTKTGYLPPYSDSLLYPDSLKNRGGEYIYDLVKNLKAQRQRAASRINNSLIADYPKKMQQRYFSGELKEDNNIFSRCVINMLIKQYP